MKREASPPRNPLPKRSCNEHRDKALSLSMSIDRLLRQNLLIIKEVEELEAKKEELEARKLCKENTLRENERKIQTLKTEAENERIQFLRRRCGKFQNNYSKIFCL